MHSRHVGVGRNAVWAVVLILVAGAAAFNFARDFGQAPGLPAQKQQPLETEADSPAQPRGNVVWLQANEAQEGYFYKGLLARELFRQSLLIAARDELGLETRDGSLREWHVDPSPQNGLGMDFEKDGITLHDIQAPSYPRWHHSYDQNSWPNDLDSIAVSMEEKSRGQFVRVLKKAGWAGTANSIKADAPAPADAEAQVMDMEELPQFGVLRETDAAIRTDGESLPRLGALVRAYANLGQLTRYHWSSEYVVYAARSLLYAQRMVVKYPDSADALWHRAYARAMAGMQWGALDDLKAANQLQGETPPAWVALLEPFCKYQTGILVNLATGDPRRSTLGMYLAFLSVEQCSCQGAIMNIARAAFTMNPRCLRIVDAMCNETGPGMLNELSETGPKIFSQELGSELQKLPSFPKALSDQIDGFRRPQGNPNGRETICEELIQTGAPDRDATEPSWAALGRLIQETTFAHVWRRANLICVQWGVDASDYVNEVQPLIADHPFKYVVDTYGLRHSADLATVRNALSPPPSAKMNTTLRQVPVGWLEMDVQSNGPTSAQNYWDWIFKNSDSNSFDIEELLAPTVMHGKHAPAEEGLTGLRRVSPESPFLIAADIYSHWDAAKAVNWEAEHGDYPMIALLLGKKYAGLQRWMDAERCFRRYIAVSPDYEGYEDLAKVYKSQQMNDQWLAMLKDYLVHGQDYGLQYSVVQEEIAKYYMIKRDFKSAAPYADAAAATGSGLGLLTAADAHTGLGDWATAEQLIVEEKNHYSASPIGWYCWCSRTGHGDIGSARSALLSYYVTKRDPLDRDDLLNLACVELAQNDMASALATFKRRMGSFPGANSALHIAILDDELHDIAARDAELDLIQTLPGKDGPLGRFGAMLRDAFKNGAASAPDGASIEKLVKDIPESEAMTIFSLMGLYLNNHNQTAEAVGYFKRCAQAKNYYNDRIWTDPLLRQNGVDPWALEQAAADRAASH